MQTGCKNCVAKWKALPETSFRNPAGKGVFEKLKIRWQQSILSLELGRALAGLYGATSPPGFRQPA